MNEDIEFIKKFIEELKILNSTPATLLPMNYKLEKSLTNIIGQIEELKAITETYKAYNTEKDSDKIIIADKRYFDNGIFMDNLISKSKIKEKIDSLELECQLCNVRNLIECDTQCTIGCSKKLLKELLESEEAE